jgi:hypothetical protein
LRIWALRGVIIRSQPAAKIESNKIVTKHRTRNSPGRFIVHYLVTK